MRKKTMMIVCILAALFLSGCRTEEKGAGNLDAPKDLQILSDAEKKALSEQKGEEASLQERKKLTHLLKGRTKRRRMACWLPLIPDIRHTETVSLNR